MKLVLIDSKGDKHQVQEKAVRIMVSKLNEEDVDEAGVKLLLCSVLKDDESVQRIGKALRKVVYPTGVH